MKRIWDFKSRTKYPTIGTFLYLHQLVCILADTEKKIKEACESLNVLNQSLIMAYFGIYYNKGSKVFNWTDWYLTKRLNNIKLKPRWFKMWMKKKIDIKKSIEVLYGATGLLGVGFSILVYPFILIGWIFNDMEWFDGLEEIGYYAIILLVISYFLSRLHYRIWENE